jgi:archaellum component FlaC
MSDDLPYSTTVKLQRGTGTDDRDTIKMQVSAGSIEELNERVRELRQEAEQWADAFRSIQPTVGRSVSDDQATLGEGDA